jgi:tRNA threonylcarbamoyladenosine biosynthesis protein TsaB
LKILAIDSSAIATSVALIEDSKLLAEFFLNIDLKHSQTLILMIDTLFKYTGFKISDIDSFAISNGPGSFTGIRIGISALKGIAMVCNKPCVPVSSLYAMAVSLPFSNAEICCIIDAKCSQVYTATFLSSDSSLSRKTPDRVVPLKKLTDELSQHKSKIFLVGDGAALCYNKLESGRSNIFLLSEDFNYQRAHSVAKAAELLLAQEKAAVSAEGLIPNYLLRSQAERDLGRVSK